MPIIDRYILRQFLLATGFVTGTLAVLILLTQSLQFLDMIAKYGSSATDFWIQTFLALPSFFEILLPIGAVASAIFIYNRLTLDNELIVLRALGFSPMRLAIPTLVTAAALGVLLFVNMGWVAPITKAEGIEIRRALKDKMTALIFQEGVFNRAGQGLMIYISDRGISGDLQGLIIHDARDPAKSPSTIIAARGILVSNNEGQQVVVYDGSRQDIDRKTGALRRLDFSRYTIDLPTEEKQRAQRLEKPEERTFDDLWNNRRPQGKNAKEERWQIRAEIQKRLMVPFLVPTFCLIGLTALLLGGYDRRGQSRRILVAIAGIVGSQVLFLIGFQMAKQNYFGFPIMLLCIAVPLIICLTLLRQDSFQEQTRGAA